MIGVMPSKGFSVFHQEAGGRSDVPLAYKGGRSPKALGAKQAGCHRGTSIQPERETLPRHTSLPSRLGALFTQPCRTRRDMTRQGRDK